jgi:hypothetical protein
VIQILFAREVAKQDRFADSGRSGDVFGLGAAEAFLREALDGDVQELAVAVRAVHPALRADDER